MNIVRVSTVGAACAIAAVACFLVGGAAMSSSGVQVLIPETGEAGRAWMQDVSAAGMPFLAGAWLVILMGFLAMAAMLGFYDALRRTGPVLLLAPVAGVIGLTLVTVSHLIPIAMAYELAPAYTEATPAAQNAMAVTADTLAATATATNIAGNFLDWGIAVPLFAVAVLHTEDLPRWIGWLGLAAGLLAGWVGALAPASAAFEALSSIGLLGFFVFLLSLGIAMLRRERRSARTPAGAPA